MKASPTTTKEINIPIASLSAVDKRAVTKFNRFFEKTDLFVSCNGKGVVVHAREVDMQKLAEVAKSVGGAAKRNKNHVVHKIHRAIDGIKSYGARNGKRNFVDYNRERKVKNRAAKEVQRQKLGYANGQFSQEENAVPASKLNKIICGDSVKVLKKLPDNCIDLVFTSPPYNFGLDYEAAGDEKKWEAYFSELFAVMQECIRVVKYGGRIVVNVQPLYSDYMPSHHIISDFFLKQGLIWRGEILWEKNNYNCKYTAWGSWKSPSNPYLKYSWEFLEIFCKGSLKKGGLRENADISADDFKKWVYGKWSIAPMRGMVEKYGHPAMFPEELARRVLQLFSFKGDVVLDPFNGAGTTTAIAHKTGRQYIGIDISPQYCLTAENRLGLKFG